MDDIQKHFPDLTQLQLEQLNALEQLYTTWNQRINVISRKDISNLYQRHVLHSLCIAKYVHFLPTDSVLDVGTGGGFPGIPLAILYPDTPFKLVDSVGKKLNVVKAVAAEIGLRNVQTHHGRAESLQDTYTFVVSRAVTRLDTIWQWVNPLIRSGGDNPVKNGLLYIKGGDIAAELPNNCSVQIIPLPKLIDEPYFAEKSLVHLYK